jgi:hypothetical protein
LDRADEAMHVENAGFASIALPDTTDIVFEQWLGALLRDIARSRATEPPLSVGIAIAAFALMSYFRKRFMKLPSSKVLYKYFIFRCLLFSTGSLCV